MRATFPAFIDEWTAIGRSTEPMDRERATAAVAAAYAAAGLPAPVVVFGVSPIGGVILRQILIAGVRGGVFDGVVGGVRDGVVAGVRDGVFVGVVGGVRDGVIDGVLDGVRDGVFDGVVAGWYRELTYGCHDAGWMSYYDWFRRNGLGDITTPLDGLTELAKSAGWCWFHRGFAVISDRPATLHDELVGRYQRRLHNANGPAVTYRDGWSVWAWHGLNVPEWVITDPTIDRITAEKNTEIRRCAIESFGWGNYLTGIGANPVDVADDPGNPGHRLALYDIADDDLFDGRVRLLVMENASRDRDGTRRTFAETVPADCLTAVSAAAWQFDTDPTIYAQLQRAT